MFTEVSFELEENDSVFKYASIILDKNKDHDQKLFAYKYFGHAFLEIEYYESAIFYYERCLVIGLEVQGPKGNEVGNAFGNIGNAYLDKGEYAKAIDYYLKSLAIELETLGPEDSGVATTSYNLGEAYLQEEEYQEAIKYYLKCLAIELKALGPKDSAVALTYYKIGRAYYGGQKYDEAIKYYRKCLAIDLETLGPEESGLEDTYDSLGNAYLDSRNYNAAIDAFEKCLEVELRLYGQNDRDSTITYNNIAFAYAENDNPRKAVENYEKSIEIQMNQKVVDMPSLAYPLMNNGVMYQNLGEVSKSIYFLRKALEIYEENNQTEQESLAHCYTNLGNSLDLEGNYKDSLYFQLKSFHVMQQIHGDDSSALPYINLGHAYANNGNSSKALMCYNKSLANNIKKFGESHPSVALDYVNIGSHYGNEDQHEKCIEFLKKALAIREKHFGKNHSLTASIYYDFGLYYDYTGNDSLSLQFYKKYLDAYLNVYGFGHPDVSIAYDLVAEATFESGDKQAALRYALLANKSSETHLSRIFSYSSSIERMKFMQNQDRNPFDMLGTIGESSSLATAVLRHKGIVLDSIIDDKKHRRMISEPLVSITEKKLGYIPRSLEIDEQSVSNKLEQGHVLLEYIKYEQFNLVGGKLENIDRYGVVLIGKNDEKRKSKRNLPIWIPLNAADLSNEKIESLGQSLTGAGSAQILRSLYDAIIAPVIPHLPLETKSLLISPDSELNFLSFPSLLDPQGKFLCETYEVLHLSSGRDLIFGTNAGTFPAENVVLFGDPDYDRNEDNSSASSLFLAFNSPTRDSMRNLSFVPLDGSKREVEQVARISSRSGMLSKLLTGDQATEEALRKVRSPKILHLATHGFFIPKEKMEERPRRFAFFQDAKRIHGDNPMQRSGLALAGAKRTLDSWGEGKSVPPGNDGILTAEEAASLDLSGTWLTALSACDTGSGVARAGEGVLGLRRAFAMAGTQNLLLTLWPVSDSFTKDFMVSFYEEALKTGNAPRAMAKVQKDWLVKLREERSVGQAVKLAGPFVLTFRGGLDGN